MNLMLSESISYYKREGFMSIVKVLKKKKKMMKVRQTAITDIIFLKFCKMEVATNKIFCKRSHQFIYGTLIIEINYLMNYIYSY